MIGRTIAHYRITAKLGAGGMGEVYRATDTKLGREVAIKVLPESFAQDPARMARFEREARVLASLNHPHIAAIYGVEERALVMELVEGPTLADRIALGAIPLEEALAIAQQITDGLEAAHEKGIVHRDLKPANVKVTPDGKVKVLDFGLATAAEEEQAASTENSPTLTMRQTQLGVILGTAGYMAPEQARGKKVDKRADIWAFGVVLYEMLTGRRLFDGEDATETLANVVTREPDWERVPARVRRLLRSCLEKDPKKRLRDIGDVWRLLDDEAAALPAQPEGRATRSGKLAWALAATAIAALAALGFVGYRHFTEETRVLRFSAQLPGRTTPNAGSIPAVSPDGRHVVLPLIAAGQQSLWIRDLDSLTARQLPGTEDATFPFWSPDSRWVGFFSAGKLKKIEASGGPPIVLCDAPQGRGGTWSQNDVILFGTNRVGIYRVPAAGGSPTMITTPDRSLSEAYHRAPWFLPDGRHFLYTARSVTADKTRIYVADLAASNKSRDRREVLAADSNAVYAAPGYLLFVRDRTLMAEPFDAGALKATGDAIPVAEQVDYFSNGSQGQFSVSRTGVMAFTSGVGEANAQITWFDRSGKSLGTVGAPGEIQWATLSPDGNAVAFDRRDPQTGLFDIWTHDLVHDTESRLTFGPQSDNQFPVWSPDGTHIAFNSGRDGHGSIYQRATNGTGQDEAIDADERRKRPVDWSRDGQYLIEETATDSKNPKNQNDIWVLPLFGDKKPFAYIHSEFIESNAKLSPDGRWLAYRSDASKRNEIYVETFPKPGGKWQISTSGGTLPVWSRDGKELYYVSADQKLTEVEIRGGPNFDRGTPRPLFEVHLPINGWYDVSKDGRFLVPTALEHTGDVPLTVVVNWQAELARK